MAKHLGVFLGTVLLCVAGVIERSAAAGNFGQPGDLLVAESGGALRWVKADGSDSSVIFDTTDRPGFSPRGVAFAANGDLIVTDFGTGSLLRIAPDGSSASVILSGLPAPAGVAVETSGDFVVISDASGPLLRIAEDGSTTETILPALKGEDVEVAANGDLFVFSETTGQLLRVSPDGSSVSEVLSDASLINPSTGDMALAPNGDFLITTYTGGGKLARVTANGSSTATIISGLSSPEGVVITENGDFIVSELGSGTLRKISPDGTSSSILFSGLGSPDHIALVPLPDSTCEADLAQCNTDLGQAQANLVQCTADLAQCSTNLSLCTSSLVQCDTDLAAATADIDQDRLPDRYDHCPSTALGAEIDSEGCSLAQFCAAIDVSTGQGVKVCEQSDWQNDEPLMKAKEADCRVEKGGPGRADDRCVSKF